MTRINTLLARIEKKLGEQPDLIQGSPRSTDARECAAVYADGPASVLWEEDQAIYPETPSPNIKEIIAALAARHKGGQAFGPIENAALTFIARLTGSDGSFVSTIVVGECSFLFPAVSFDGTQKGLRCWLGINWGSFPSDLRGELLEEKVLEFQALELPGSNGEWPKRFQVSGKICFQLGLRSSETFGNATLQKVLESLYAQFHCRGIPASAPLNLRPSAFKIMSTETT